MQLQAQTHESKFRISSDELTKLIKEHVASQLNVPIHQISVSYDVSSDPYADDARYRSYDYPKFGGVKITVNHLLPEPFNKDIKAGLTKKE